MDCFSHMDKNATVQAKFWIISSEGASGDYPGCTDKAYAKAVSDGVDILDCLVQMTSDGIRFYQLTSEIKQMLQNLNSSTWQILIQTSTLRKEFSHTVSLGANFRC